MSKPTPLEGEDDLRRYCINLLEGLLRHQGISKPATEVFYQDVDDLYGTILAITATKEREAEIAGMQKAKSRVLRRTEIPADAKNPTRDFVVILGEEIAGIIDTDIAHLNAKEKEV